MSFILRPKPYQVLLCLVVLGFFVYGNTLSFPFVHDDIAFIINNPNIARWDNILDAFLTPGVGFASFKIVTPYYRPVLEVLYRLEYALWGTHPAGYHAVNILLHAVNGFLVYLLMLSWAFSGRMALGVAVFFLVHPLQSEAVACFSGISNLAAGFFMLAAVLYYVRARDPARGGRRFLFWLSSAAAFVAALFTKEQAVTLPLFLLLFEWIQRGDAAGRKGWLKRLGLFFLLTALFLAWRAHLFPVPLAGLFDNPEEFRLRLWAIPQTFLVYAGLVVFPAGLHYYRSIDILAVHPSAVLAASLVVLAVTGILFRMPQALRRQALTGLAWAGAVSVFSFNIVPLVIEYSYLMTAEHFLYLPLVGLLAFLAVGMAWAGGPFWRGLSRPVRGALVVGAVLLLSSVTVRQNTFWRGEVPLFERTLEHEPGLGRVHALLGKAYAAQGRYDEALEEASRALAIMQGYLEKVRSSPARPVYEQFIKMIHVDRARAYAGLGDRRRSLEEYGRSFSIRVKAGLDREMNLMDSRSASALGLGAIQAGRRNDARKFWQISAALDGQSAQSADVFNNLGLLAFERGDAVTAEMLFRRALKVSPGFPMAVMNLKRITGK
jgi:tetratricopeptide (TPR) repeat protein